MLLSLSFPPTVQPGSLGLKVTVIVLLVPLFSMQGAAVQPGTSTESNFMFPPEKSIRRNYNNKSFQLHLSGCGDDGLRFASLRLVIAFQSS